MRLVDHNWRRGHGLRLEFLNDWQANEGSLLDAPSTWHPAGGMRANQHFTAESAYCLRTGYTLAPRNEPALHVVFVTVQGVRYRCHLEQGRLAEAKGLHRGARELRRGQGCWSQVEHAAWSAAA